SSSSTSAVKSAVSAVTNAVTNAVTSAVVKRAERTTSSVADRSSDASGPTAGSAASCTEVSAIELSFNPAPIAEGNVIWFHSAMGVNGLGADPATIYLNDAS